MDNQVYSVMTQVITQVKNKEPIYCKWCGTVEITFDARKSKSGKAIPICKQSGLPHNCDKSPFAFAQHKQEPQKVNEPEVKTTDRVYWNLIIEKVDALNAKLDKLLEVKQ